MGESPAKRAFYRSAWARAVIAYAAACALFVVWYGGGIDDWLCSSSHVYKGYDWVLKHEAWLPIYPANMAFQGGYLAALVVAPFAVFLGAIIRVLARARVRAGLADPLDRVRRFAEKHRVLFVAAGAAPLVLWQCREALHTVRAMLWYRGDALPMRFAALALITLVASAVHILLARRALAALVAPTRDERAEVETAKTADDFVFAAVALTRETRFMVNAFAGVTAALVAVLLVLPTFDSLAVDVSVALYVPLAILAALRFRRASRIAVGLDGIHVHGSSRSRFYAFKDLDGVTSTKLAIELTRGNRVVLRLQLHGPDAIRRDALVERLAAAVARAADERDQPVTSFVNGATRDALARAAEGGGNYRDAAVSRDQLWTALEGPAVASEARAAAAEALAISQDPAERARLRVAVDRCAEPQLRARLQDLLVTDDHADDAPDPAPPLLARHAGA